MKRILCILLSVCLLLCLGACAQNDEEPRGTKPSSPTEGQKPTEPQPTTEEPTEPEPTEPEPTEPVIVDEPDPVRVLTMEKALHTYYEWEDDLIQALVRSEHSCVTLGQEDAARYPQMAQVLSQIAAMQENAMLDEFDNLVSTAREALSVNREGFETYVSTLDVQVRRADSLVISLLSDSYSDYGQIENYRVFHGSNYDTETGRELMLNEVVDISNDLALAVQAELTGHMWAGEFNSESAVEDYFANTPYDSFSWTLDYTGVTFYFAPGELCDGGAMTATVSFAQYPELFAEKYLEAPARYTVELPLDISFFAQWDADEELDALSISGWYDPERNSYLDYGVYSAAGYYYEECYAYAFHPYYVNAETGHYLYLFCEEFDAGMRQMRLVILSLNSDGSVSKAGEKNVSPAWLSDNRFLVPTDPDCFVFDEPDDGEYSALDTTRLEVISFDAEVLTEETYAILYEIVNRESGEVCFETDDDVRFLTFEEDGRGCFWTDNEKGRPFRYEMDSAYSCAISFDDGGKASLGLYADQGGALPGSEAGAIWIVLYLEDELLWFY